MSSIPSTPHKKRLRDISNSLLTPKTSPSKRIKSTNFINESLHNKKKLDFGVTTQTQSPIQLLTTPPTTPTKRQTSIYSQAKALFQRSSGGTIISKNGLNLVGRDHEGEYLYDFFMKNLISDKCNSLYVSGPPGTGKTAQLQISFNHLLSKFGNNKNSNPFQDQDKSVITINGKKIKLVKVNCMAINNPEHIYHEIYCQMVDQLSISFIKKKTYEDFQQLMNTNPYDSIVVVLDELDCLVTKNQHVLFELFSNASPQNSHQYKSKLVLIGISNALDLTDKFLPRLKRNGYNPFTLQFLPYTSDQIKSVIILKLKCLSNNEEEEVPLFNSSAIQLCCKKSAAISGDLRKSFDICYKSIELVEQAIITKGEVDIHTLTIDNCPKILITHIAKVCASSFGENSSTKLSNLNLLQKAVLCCLFHYQTQNLHSYNDLTVNRFYDYYVKHSLQNVDKLIGILKKGEFLDIVNALESTSVVVLSDTKDMKKQKIVNTDTDNKIIKPNITYDLLIKGLGDVIVLKKILYGN
ncbi:cell cycle control protein [Scheffersomyces coipomensis]|uniref:cell cycle control protein n=1 Tax=Scheffersomyces coipomensis TaxID=1788519 RepID=UPI00315C653A